jgi:hypothetical protein
MRMSLMWSLSPAMGVTVMGMDPPAGRSLVRSEP